jgi:ribosomal protein S16|tara:strand:- start:428 stop:583 length:156 start_codon:yes stop_codon:yes gene_type:complete
MRKIREYRGCELESPLYRQVVAEMSARKGGETQVINEYKPKRGKYSNNNNK